MTTRRSAASRRATPAALALLAAATLVGGAAACRGGAAESPTAADAAISVGAENLAVADSEEIRIGPQISGSLEALQSATVRAQVGGSVLAVNGREGNRVRRGELLARIETAGLGATQASARSAVASAQAALQQANRDADRSRTLAAAGAIAPQQAEQAQNAVAVSRSQLAAAQSQLATASQQLGNTRVTSPMNGVISNRAVNEGDVVQVGAALFTVVQPSSMQLEAAVPSGELGSVQVGDAVRFTVNGYPGREFTGTVQRISPAADPMTRQVPIWVTIPNPGGTLVAGLFAQGQVAQHAEHALTIPTSAVDTASLASAGGKATAMRVRRGRAEEVRIELGPRDADGATATVRSGLSRGDTVLVGTAREVTPGTPIQILRGTAATAPAQP